MGKFGRKILKNQAKRSPKPPLNFSGSDYATEYVSRLSPEVHSKVLVMVNDIMENYGESVDALNESFRKYQSHPLFEAVRMMCIMPGSDIHNHIGDLFIRQLKSSFSQKFDHNDMMAFFKESRRLHSIFKRLIYPQALELCEKHGMTEWVNIYRFGIDFINKEPKALEEVANVCSKLENLNLPGIGTASSFEELMIWNHYLFSNINHHALFFAEGVGHKFINNADNLYRLNDQDIVTEWSRLWYKSGFARVGVGHKLASAFSLTDVPEEVESPWEYWSLVVPSDMFPVTVIVSGKPVLSTYIERVWCKGSSVFAIVWKITSKHLADPDDIKRLSKKLPVMIAHRPHEIDVYDNVNLLKTINNLVRSICLSTTNKASDRSGNWGKITPKKYSKFDIPEVSGEDYFIGRPITIDLRDELKEYLNSNRSSSSPKVQFLVRGHFRNQRFGEGRLQTRRQWIEPFWKGNSEMRTLLRSYEVKKIDDDTST